MFFLELCFRVRFVHVLSFSLDVARRKRSTRSNSKAPAALTHCLLCWGYIGGNIGILEKKMETTIMGHIEYILGLYEP